MVGASREFNALVELIFGCAERGGDLQPALATIATHLDAIAAHVLVFQDGTLVDTHFHGSGRPAFSAYERDWQDKDPRFVAGIQNPGRILSDVEVITPSTFEASPIYNDFLRPYGVRYTLFGNAAIAPGLGLAQAFMREKRARPFDAEHVRLLTSLGPHLRRALQLRQLIRGLDDELGDLRRALDVAPCPVAVLDGKGRLLGGNALAHHVLAVGDGLRLRRQAVEAQLPGEGQRLVAAVAQAAALAEGTPRRKSPHPPPAAVQISRQHGRPLGVVLIPLRPSSLLREAGGRSARILAVIYDPDTAPTVNTALVAQLHGLTVTEALLASALAQGKSLAQFATERGCTQQTARTHLKRVLDKTGTHRQAELVTLLLGNAALRLNVVG